MNEEIDDTQVDIEAIISMLEFIRSNWPTPTTSLQRLASSSAFAAITTAIVQLGTWSILRERQLNETD